VPTAQQLAVEFCKVLRSWLTDADFHAIIQANKESDPSLCATHEYCDPNQAMLDAMAKFGMDLDIESEKQGELIDKAWSIAKKAGFLPDRCGEK